MPVIIFSTALCFYDGYRSARLPANLLQGQRDYFGAHTYERTDQPRGKFFHTDFLLQLDGVEEQGGIAKAFKNDSGVDVHFAPPKMVVSGKVAHAKPIQTRQQRCVKCRGTAG